MADTPYYRIRLRQELERRQAKNASYSLRAFAKSLAIDAAVLSRAINGKRVFSYGIAERAAVGLALPEKERLLFLGSIAQEKTRRALAAASASAPGTEAPREIHYLENDLFEAIGDLAHYAILELTYVVDFRSDPRWIARQLGITVIEAERAVERLLRLGLLVRKDGRLQKAKSFITTKDKSRTSAELRRHHRQILARAAQSLETDPYERRSMSGTTLPIDPSKLPVARRMIDEFRAELCRVLTSGRMSKVYQLGISLFPLQK
jgi:uncharacterized protein (TIGR02147 family)